MPHWTSAFTPGWRNRISDVAVEGAVVARLRRRGRKVVLRDLGWRDRDAGEQDYQHRIAAAAPADKERLLNEAVNALAKAITDQGLSVEEYDSILKVAQNDPEFREKIRQRIRPSSQ